MVQDAFGGRAQDRRLAERGGMIVSCGRPEAGNFGLRRSFGPGARHGGPLCETRGEDSPAYVNGVLDKLAVNYRHKDFQVGAKTGDADPAPQDALDESEEDSELATDEPLTAIPSKVEER